MKALVQYMAVKGFTQKALADFIGVDQGQLNHWLRGNRSPSAGNLKRISKKTGISLEKLVEDL